MIRHLLLDLDNTLYPASDGMDEAISRRMLEYVARFVGVSLEEGIRLRNERLPLYGTTLEWLTAEHNLTDRKAYFEAVHPESEINDLQKDPNLRAYLLSLSYPMTLLTNAPMAHAKRLLEFFHIEDLFLGVFDITYHKGVGKPHAQCFNETLAAVGFTIEETLFVDDYLKYIRGFKAIGGKSVLVDETGKNTEVARKEGFCHIRTIYELKALLDRDQFLTDSTDIAITI